MKYLILKPENVLDYFRVSNTSQLPEMTIVIPWVPPREVRVDVGSDLNLPGGRLSFRAAHWKCTRVSVKTEWGTSNLLSRELELLSGLFHPNILLLMATTTSGPNNCLQLIFEQVALGSLYQCLHVRPEPGLVLLLNRVDVLLQVNDCNLSLLLMLKRW